MAKNPYLPGELHHAAGVVPFPKEKTFGQKKITSTYDGYVV